MLADAIVPNNIMAAVKLQTSVASLLNSLGSVGPKRIGVGGVGRDFSVSGVGNKILAWVRKKMA